ncbi:MAG: hypothetical protein HRU20_13020 [Pseudomonadales bacterium]|nr:hypothetical protein [Pseudomonadales bacterium]
MKNTLAVDLQETDLDFSALRSQGIKYLEKISSTQWTDFNAHDPGITILEQLCYVLTDLGYRAGYDIQDLLANADGAQSLHGPAEVLAIKPVTLRDYRKLVIDVPGVKNAWLQEVQNPDLQLYYDSSEQEMHFQSSASRENINIEGVYDVLIETDVDSLRHPSLIAQVKHRLHANRAVCIDFNTPVVLQTQSVKIDALIDIDDVDDANLVLASIYQQLADTISPTIPFYSLEELLEKGICIDEAMNGPVLDNGFILDDELDHFQLKDTLRSSDLIRIIMDIPGVSAVSHISLSDEPWYLKLSKGSAPYLDVDKSTIKLVRGQLVAQTSPSQVKKIYNQLNKGSHSQRSNAWHSDMPVGRNRNPGKYYSLLHQFPENYGIGELGLKASVSPQRKAGAQQLKAYLLLFDQILANNFSQLANAQTLLSYQSDDLRSYFSQPVADVGLQLDTLFAEGLELRTQTLQKITESAGDDFSQKYGRKHRFLNHLLARFAEEFNDYSLFYGIAEEEGSGGARGDTAEQLLRRKAKFLELYPQIGSARGSGFDYQASSAENQGLKARLQHKLGLIALDSDDVPATDFYMLEHILLRPQVADKTAQINNQGSIFTHMPAVLSGINRSDPYSSQISYVFPALAETSDINEKKHFIWKTLREETPAHIEIYLHWFNEKAIKQYKQAWQQWVDCIVTDEDRYIRLRDARDRLICLLNIGIPLPIQDLILEYPATIALDQSANINIIDAQPDVRYQLCDEDGNPVMAVDKNGKTLKYVIEGSVDSGHSDRLSLWTPAITKDISFTILALRTDNRSHDFLEAYLNQDINIKAGINTALVMNVLPGEDQLGEELLISINYDQGYSVCIHDSQEGISYQLVTGEAGEVILSEPIIGNKSSITLQSNTLREDTKVQVKAYRTLQPSIFAFLDAKFIVSVRPDADVLVALSKEIIDFNTAVSLSIVSPQTTSEYRLYKLRLKEQDYLPAGIDSLSVKTEQGREIVIRKPQIAGVWKDSEDQILVADFEPGSKSGKMSVTTSLSEDSVFIIRAIKKGSQLSVALSTSLVVLVRPDPRPILTALEEPVKIGDSGRFMLENTQQGVSYQLLQGEDQRPVNTSGFDYRDQALETTRVGIDFRIGSSGEPGLLLTSEALSAATEFSVCASKTITGLTTLLTTRVSLNVEAVDK